MAKANRNVVELGDRVTSMIDGFTGIVTGKSQWITGCDQVSVRGQSIDGKASESFWFDIHAVKIVEKGAVKIDNNNADGGGPPTRSPK